jgi:hypothetical protein
MSERLIECKSNAGFEDIITEGKEYKRVALGVNSVQIEDDNGDRKWLGMIHFIQD